MMHPAIKRRIDGYLLFANDIDLDLGLAFLMMSTLNPDVEHRCLFERELETAKDDGV